MGFRGMNGTSHKTKKKKSDWKGKYIKQRSLDANNPALRAYTSCPACLSEGKNNTFKFVGKYTLPRSQDPKSRF
ncbi:hypothetical protein D3C74_172980 [compost metagenome]